MSQRSRIHLLWASLSAAICLAPGCGSTPSEVEKTTPAAQEARVEAERGPLRVEAWVEPHPIQLSDEPKLTLTLSYENGVKVTPPPFGDAIGEFQILEQRDSLPETREGRRLERFTYILEPMSSGQLLIPPIDVQYIDERKKQDGERQTLTTEALAVEVATMIDVARPSLDDLSGLSQPIPLASRPAWLPWAIVGTLSVAAFLGFLWWRARGKAPVVPERSPWEQARRELDELIASSRAREQIKEFYVALTGIVRRFIEGTTGVHAPEQTTEEFLYAIHRRPGFADEQRVRLQAFLESADLVKYAGHYPTSEDIASACGRADEFIGASDPENHQATNSVAGEKPTEDEDS